MLKYLFDFDDTLWSRDISEEEISIDNIRKLNLLDNAIIISGNTFDSIKDKIIKALGSLDNCNFDIWADANTTLYRKGTEMYSIKELEIDEDSILLDKIKELKLEDKMSIIRNSNNKIVNIKIKPVEDRDRICKLLQNDKYKVIKAGKTTIDILNINNSKLYTYNNEIKGIEDKSARFIYFGDEIYNGNDFDIAHECNDFIEIKDIRQTNKILDNLIKNKTFTYGLIIAAGKQTRFTSDIPKALVKIKNTTLLDMNIENMKEYCDKIYVVCSFNNEEYFDRYNKIPIESGKGNGDAILKALDIIDNDYCNCIIKWGDAYHDKEIYKEINFNNKLVIPVKYEENPYVQLYTDTENNIEKVTFSKYNEKITDGYHDLSIFYVNIGYIREYLIKFANKITINGNYVHKHNNELEFLDLFNDTDIIGKIQIINDDNIFSFNTIEELNKIMENRYEN